MFVQVFFKFLQALIQGLNGGACILRGLNPAVALRISFTISSAAAWRPRTDPYRGRPRQTTIHLSEIVFLRYCSQRMQFAAAQTCKERRLPKNSFSLIIHGQDLLASVGFLSKGLAHYGPYGRKIANVSNDSRFLIFRRSSYLVFHVERMRPVR